MIQRKLAVIFFVSMFVYPLHAMDITESSKLGAWKVGKSLHHLCLAIVAQKIIQLKHGNPVECYNYCKSLMQKCLNSVKVYDLVASQVEWIEILSEEYVNFSRLQMLAQQPIDIDVPGEEAAFVPGGKVPIYALAHASKRQEIGFMQLLLEKGACPNVPLVDALGFLTMPLYNSMFDRVLPHLVKLLVGAGADLDYIDTDGHPHLAVGESALTRATYDYDIPTIKLIYNAAPHMADHVSFDGKTTPRILAQQRGIDLEALREAHTA